ncbi:hypothetical protein BJ741DRAFT_580193 [Chytriomyces cf. hyalinus JEL632]|nr:hypothetical protein BJ741DRAFT_580193 [Chytriomyces cf. hyalinus JEL632]
MPNSRGGGSVPDKTVEKGVIAPPEVDNLLNFANPAPRIRSPRKTPTTKVVFKMSKKIAQLTKVIYYLNTKNEDHNVEIQSLIDAYEDELTETIKDGTLQIETMKNQLRDAQENSKLCEETIDAHVRTIDSQLQELRDCYHREEEMKELMEGVSTDADRKIRSNLVDMHELTKSQEIVQEEKTQARLNELTQAHELELDQLRLENESTVKACMEDYKSVQGLLKDTVNTMNRQMEEERKQFTSEKERMAKDHEHKIAEIETENAEKQRQTLEELEHITKRYKEVAENLESLQTRFKRQVWIPQPKKKSSQIQRLMDLLFSQKIQLDEATESLEQRTIEVSDLRSKVKASDEIISAMKMKIYQDLDVTSKSLEDTTDKLNVTQAELQSKTTELVAKSITAKELKEKLDTISVELEATVANFESAQLLQSNTNSLLTLLACLSERKLVLKEEEIRQLALEMNERREHELEDQKNGLTDMFEEKLSHTIDIMNQERTEMIEKKDAEMTETLEKHTKSIEEWNERLVQQKAAAAEQQAFMQDQLDKMEEAKNLVKEKYESSLKVIQEKVNEIQGHLSTIQTLQNAIKALEADKADLFQKMVKIDDQIRGEMNDRFRREKMEMTQAWETMHATEMQNLRDTLTSHHHYELMTAIEKTETDYKEQITVLSTEHSIRTEEWENQKIELQDKMMGFEICIKMQSKAMVDLKEDHTRQIAKLIDDHAKLMEQERKNFEYELTAKETQLKVASTIALGNLEKRHAVILEELEAEHKRSMDDVKNTNTKNALAAKKGGLATKDNVFNTQDAENKLNAEIARLKAIHDQEMEAQELVATENLAKTILSMNMKRIGELKDLGDAHQLSVDALNTKILELNQEILRQTRCEHTIYNVKSGQNVEENLLKQVEGLEATISDLEDEIRQKKHEIAQLKERHEESLEAQYNELIREHEANIAGLNEDHIQEAQKMITEFQHVQDFLKKQIANQLKLLEEADVKYINREPRDVDVAKIAELEEDIRRRKRKAHALMEELEYCKLELSNREANFNKIFNKNPLVGVIQPIGMGKETAAEKEQLHVEATTSALVLTVHDTAPACTPICSHRQNGNCSKIRVLLTNHLKGKIG